MPSESRHPGRRLGVALLPAFVILLIMIAMGLPGNQPIATAQVVAMLVPLIGFAWLLFWIVQFVDLMSLGDVHFMGRYDKLIWGAVFVFLFPLAPFAFWLWKQRMA